MADFTGDAHVPVVRRAIEDEPGADARSDLHEHEVADAAVGPPGDFRECAKIGVVVYENGELQRVFKMLQDVDANPFGQDGALRHGARPTVDGTWDSDAGTHYRAALHSAVLQQLGKQCDGF